MARTQNRHPPLARAQPARADGPYWRAVLEERWRLRLQELTELSVAYHGAETPGRAGGSDGVSTGPGPVETRRLLRRAVGARRTLADVEEALARLAAGDFGRCEQCGEAIPDGLLAVMPEARYCPRCAARAGLRPAVPPALARGLGASDTW